MYGRPAPLRLDRQCRPRITYPKPWDRTSQTLHSSGACCGPVWPCLCPVWALSWLPWGAWHCQFWLSALSGAGCGPLWPCHGLPGGLHLGFLALPMLAPLPSCHWPNLFFLPFSTPRPAEAAFRRQSCSRSGFSTTILQQERLFDDNPAAGTTFLEVTSSHTRGEDLRPRLPGGYVAWCHRERGPRQASDTRR